MTKKELWAASGSRCKCGEESTGWIEIKCCNICGLPHADENLDERPSNRYRPSLSIDGNQWCALYGENLQDGVAGFGDSPEEAYRNFDKAWDEKLPSSNAKSSDGL